MYYLKIVEKGGIKIRNDSDGIDVPMHKFFSVSENWLFIENCPLGGCVRDGNHEIVLSCKLTVEIIVIYVEANGIGRSFLFQACMT